MKNHLKIRFLILKNHLNLAEKVLGIKYLIQLKKKLQINNKILIMKYFKKDK